MKKINFKQPKYVIPIIVLIPLLFIGYKIISMYDTLPEESEIVKQTELSTNLGEVMDSIMSKNEAYDNYYERNMDNTMFGDLEKEENEKYSYSDNYTEHEKYIMDSIQNHYKELQKQYNQPRSNYQQGRQVNYANNDSDYDKQLEILKLIENSQNQPVNSYDDDDDDDDEFTDPLRMMKEQMLLLDSLEKSNNPEYIKQKEIERKLKADNEKYDEFLNSTLYVSKYLNNSHFKTISNKKTSKNIIAIVDESIKGYMGSRLRIKILEDIKIGETKMPGGSIVYAQISGFKEQRVFLNIVSVIIDEEILPVNLSVYDIDGMKGLYVPQSDFREMMKELGQTTVQGQNINSSSESFTSSMISQLFMSTSQSVVKLIRKNKTKLKYNTHIYLVNDKKQ